MFRTSASQSLSGIDHLIFLRLVDMNEQTRIVYSGTSYVESLVPASVQRFQQCYFCQSDLSKLNAIVENVI